MSFVRRPSEIALIIAGVRMALVKGFPNYLVFYFPKQNGIAIERVIHAKQDYPRLLR